MARKFFRYPPRPSSGAGTFSDNIVGLQIVQGGGLTQGNFEFTTNITEKSNRNFNIGLFSEPITLDSLNVLTVNQSREIAAKEFRVFPNFDLSEITKFNLYGSLSKRISSSVQKIINFFPASIESYNLKPNFTTGYTAVNIEFDFLENTTTFQLQVDEIINPFGVDFSVNSTRNLLAREITVSPLRDLTVNFEKYSLYVGDGEYNVLFMEPSESLFYGYVTFIVEGNPFPNQKNSTDDLIIRPNDFFADRSFIENFDEVEQFLLNRLVTPKYTASFKVPFETNEGEIVTEVKNVTWPLDGVWNLDIKSPSFEFYLTNLNEKNIRFIR